MNNGGGPVWLHNKALDLDSLDLNSRFELLVVSIEHIT